MTPEQIESAFTYLSLFGTQPERHSALRLQGNYMVRAINDLCPESREKSLAITNLQQCIMWANASIAINEKE